MSELSYLIEEICAGLEIYFSSRTGGQYRKTAYILCDDYTELTSKFFLLEGDKAWSDRKPGTNPDKFAFKSYAAVLDDVTVVVSTRSATDVARIAELHANMLSRRLRRNEFFHATKLLELTVNSRTCIEAYSDLLEYGELLLGTRWTDMVSGTRAMEAMRVLLQLDLAAMSDETLPSKIDRVLASWPGVKSGKKLGIQSALHPDDLHLRMALRSGPTLRDALARLLP